MAAKYRVLRGLNYPPGKRAEAGETVDDLPDASVRWLLRRGAIEPIVNVTRLPDRPKPTPPTGKEAA